MPVARVQPHCKAERGDDGRDPRGGHLVGGQVRQRQVAAGRERGHQVGQAGPRALLRGRRPGVRAVHRQLPLHFGQPQLKPPDHLRAGLLRRPQHRDLRVLRRDDPDVPHPVGTFSGVGGRVTQPAGPGGAALRGMQSEVADACGDQSGRVAEVGALARPSQPRRRTSITCVTGTSRNAIPCRLFQSEMNRKITAGWSINWQTRWSHPRGNNPQQVVPCSWQTTLPVHAWPPG
jgi:hypothetical protein